MLHTKKYLRVVLPLIFMSILFSNVQAGLEFHGTPAGKKKLVISLAGAGVYKKYFISSITPPFNASISEAKKDDQITDIAKNFLDPSTMAITGFPNFSGATPSWDLDDSWWTPSPSDLANYIKSAVSQMQSYPKIVLIGKSMGACKLFKTAEALNSLGIAIDLLILVDASCYIAYHDNDLLTTPNNVKNVINLRQDNHTKDQCGYAVRSNIRGQDILVNKYNTDLSTTMCATDVNHESIDECQGLLDFINRIVKAELAGFQLGPIINQLLE